LPCGHLHAVHRLVQLLLFVSIRSDVELGRIFMLHFYVFIGVLQVWLVVLRLQCRFSIERGHRNVVLAVHCRHVYALHRLQLLFFVSFGRDVGIGRIFMLQPLSDRLLL
jgi:hypothetical protein